MSDVNLELVVNNNSIVFTPEPNEISITPTDIGFNIFTGGIGVPGGSINEVQINGGNVLLGASGLTYTGTTTNISNANVGNATVNNIVVNGQTDLGQVGNISILGGSNGSILTTDGAGNLSWNTSAATANYANFAGNAFSVTGSNVVGTVANANFAAYSSIVTASNQPNITSLGTQTNFTSNGVVNFTNATDVLLGSVNNVQITGGINGYFLQTDGTGNLTWSAGTGGGGNGSPGGANTQVQFNNAGVFGGDATFTFDSVSGNVSAVGFVGNLYGPAWTVANSSQPNITSLGTLTSLTVSGLTSIQEASEQVTPNATGASGTQNFDVLTSAIILKTADATSNFTINIRGNSTTTLNSVIGINQSLTCTFINKNGATGYYANVIQIDGNTVTPKYLGGSVPAQGTINGQDVYTFNIIKTASATYNVLLTVGGYK